MTYINYGMIFNLYNSIPNIQFNLFYIYYTNYNI